jgi:ATP-dependent 26S proteasome regulatory subunit
MDGKSGTVRQPPPRQAAAQQPSAPQASPPAISLEPLKPVTAPVEPTPVSTIPPRKGPMDELDVLIRARYPIIYVVSWEEERVEQNLKQIAAARNKKLHVWTCTQGILQSGEEPKSRKNSGDSTTDPVAALDAVLANVEPAIYLFKDFHPFTEDQRVNIPTIRRLRDVAHELRDTYKTIVIVAPMMRLAPELQKDVTVIEFKPPTTADLYRLLDRIIDDVKDRPSVKINLDAEGKEQLVQAAKGLTLKEAENVFAKTLVLHGKIDVQNIGVIFSEKQQVIKKNGVLEYWASDEDLATVGGLENLKDWLIKRGKAFSAKAADYGLPPPKGVLLLGVQGCGKSLSAKAISSVWKLPLLRFDVGRVYSSLVGSSEDNVRLAIQTAEAVAPCILWVDEIEKAFSGAVTGAGSDAGTASRVFGTFLTWLGDKTSPVFVIATANNINVLPPEFVRKGRFDEIFFVDLPNEREREEIFRIHFEKKGRVPDGFDLAELAKRSDGYSGAEIEQAIVSGMFDAFSEGKELNTDAVLKALADSVPLSRTMNEQLVELRTWAKGRARPASISSGGTEIDSLRKIEL